VTVNIEVTAADIARIAGVGRAAVSNWRRRHPDFPAPIGGPPNSPTFALADVEAWLSANGRTAGVNTSAPKVIGRHADSADAVLARAMAALLPSLSHGTVLDPACGNGSLLAAAVERLGSRLHYVGQDIDPAQVDLAQAALSEAGASKIAVGVRSPYDDQLAGSRGEADAVISITPVAEPPVGGMTWEYGQPSRNDQPLGWVQVFLSHLKPGGIAVVAVPFAMAVRASGRRIRAELLRAGALTDVIGLPEKATTTAVPWQIWMLTRPADRPAYVLRMVDLTDRTPDDLPGDDNTWAAVLADAARTRDVPSIELLDEDVFLVPAAYIAVEARDVTPEYAGLRERYSACAHWLPNAAPALRAGDTKPPGSLVTVGDLARSGALALVDRDAARPGDILIPGTPGSFEAFVLEDTGLGEVKAASVLRCDPAALNPYFLACFLRSEINRRQAAGTMGGTFRLDVRRARIPRMPLSEQRRYGEAFRRLMEFAGAADKVAAAAAAAARTAIDGLTSGIFAPEEP
jgi:SAM-dependent methyltransferase